MAREPRGAKTSTISHAAPTSPTLFERYRPGPDGSPRWWIGVEKDLPPDGKLVISGPFLGSVKPFRACRQQPFNLRADEELADDHLEEPISIADPGCR